MSPCPRFATRPRSRVPVSPCLRVPVSPRRRVAASPRPLVSPSPFPDPHLLLLYLRFRQDCPHFKNRNDRQEPDEQEQEREEESNRADEHGEVPDGWGVHAPR